MKQTIIFQDVDFQKSRCRLKGRTISRQAGGWRPNNKLWGFLSIIHKPQPHQKCEQDKLMLMVYLLRSLKGLLGCIKGRFGYIESEPNDKKLKPVLFCQTITFCELWIACCSFTSFGISKRFINSSLIFYIQEASIFKAFFLDQETGKWSTFCKSKQSEVCIMTILATWMAQA